MKIRRFVAVDMRTALTQIKEELGPEAVIMSNKKIPEGVELMAAVDYGQSSAPTTSTEPSVSIPVQSAQPAVITDDVVNLSSRAVPTAQSANASVAPPQDAQGQNAPADSLQALLNRKVQQAPAATSNVQASSNKNEEVSLEEQLKSFTDRLVQSAEQPAAQSNHSNESMISDDPSAIDMPSMSSMSKPATQATPRMTDTAVSMDDFNRMKEEMASIRQLLEHQVSGLMWQDMAQRDPGRALLTNKLMDIGISEQIADQVAGYIPNQSSESEAMNQALALLTQQLNTTQNDIIKRGGVVSIVGPTGVGKTTTVAKLAAKFAQLHGPEQVVLISTDTYRIGGYQQLETYGKIIGCQVKLAKDAETLDQILSQLTNRKLVLIDTAGMGQRDMRLAEHLSSLVSNSRVRIRNYLVLSANTQATVMQENVERFKKIPLCGCIYTKLDESLSVGEIISTSIQNGLPIGYLTDGQRVPEDIKVANAEKLVSLAEKMASKSAIKNSMNSRMVIRSTSAVG